MGACARISCALPPVHVKGAKAQSTFLFTTQGDARRSSSVEAKGLWRWADLEIPTAIART
jgi:hypothetical protein